MLLLSTARFLSLVLPTVARDDRPSYSTALFVHTTTAAIQRSKQ